MKRAAPPSCTRRRVALAASMVIAAGLAAIVTAQPPATAPATAPAEAQPIAFQPIGYFNDRCGSCHGNYGAFWGEGFARHLDDAALREMVREMTEGPAQAPLDPQPLGALIAYHRSLADGTPFILISRRDGGVLAGEVTPGATVIARSGERTIAATVDGHSWTLTLDEIDSDWTIVATRGQQTTRLPVTSWHSHQPK